MPDASRQVLFIERVEPDGPIANAELWVVTLDAQPGLKQPLPITEGSTVRATLLEYRRQYDPATRSPNGWIDQHWGTVARQGYAVPATGTVTIESYSDHTVTAVLNLRADTGLLRIGQRAPGERRLAGRFVLPLTDDTGIRTGELPSRTGATYREPHELSPEFDTRDRETRY